MQKLLPIIFSLGVAALVFSSCQKDDVFKSEQQTEKSHSTLKFSNDKKSLGSIPPANLPGPYKYQEKTRDSIGEKIMFCSILEGVNIRLDRGRRYITVKMRKLVPPPDFSKGNEYSIEIWDYAVQADWWLFTLWHKRHVTTMDVNKYYNASIDIVPGHLFASKGSGSGRRELWFYLSKKIDGKRYYRVLFVHKYWQYERKKFDNFSHIEPWTSKDDLCSDFK